MGSNLSGLASSILCASEECFSLSNCGCFDSNSDLLLNGNSIDGNSIKKYIHMHVNILLCTKETE